MVDAGEGRRGRGGSSGSQSPQETEVTDLSADSIGRGKEEDVSSGEVTMDEMAGGQMTHSTSQLYPQVP